MPSTLPDGEPVPPDGSLPDQAYAGSAGRTLSFYLHVPFCATRCGYCDFNTYTAAELGQAGSLESWYEAALREIDLSAKILGTQRRVSTVFVGGGTPSLAGAEVLAGLLTAVEQRFGLAPDAEVTTEANPESTDRPLLDRLRSAGYTRLSLGMQSTSPGVLAVLDRRHTSGRAQQVVEWALRAGFEHVNLDLIYGAPGERPAEFAASLAAAVATGADHVSAYSLIIEPGTRMAQRVRRGELAPTPDDELADRYLLADDMLTGAGYHWYEVSNWARTAGAECRHNLAYWRSQDWWGIGPGAHSHVGGVRWWNVKHPHRYAALLADGRSPGQAREVLDPATRHTERVLLELRLADGAPAELLAGTDPVEIETCIEEGALDATAWASGRAVLTRRGRLLADGIALRLLG